MIRSRVTIAVWVIVILFSSTSLAGRLSDHAFTSVATVFTDVQHNHSAVSDLYVIAEKSFHLLLFSTLGFLLWKVIPKLSRKVTLILFVGLVIGLLSEAVQLFFPDRDPTFRDVFIDLVGTAIGCLSARAIGRRQQRQASDA